MATRTDEQTIEAIAGLRRLRFNGPVIAEVPERPVPTVAGILTRIAMGKLALPLRLSPTTLSHRPTRPISCLNNLLGSYN